MNKIPVAFLFDGEWWSLDMTTILNLMSEERIKNLSDRDLKFALRTNNNLEIQRKVREIIGLERYLKILNAKVIHEELDAVGNPMKLYEINDTQNVKTILLEVVCPSTGRIYHMYPPNQEAKTCSEAKESTFSKKITYRHGDVGIAKRHGDNELIIET